MIERREKALLYPGIQVILKCLVQSLEISQLKTNELKRLLGTKLFERGKLSPNQQDFHRREAKWKTEVPGARNRHSA